MDWETGPEAASGHRGRVLAVDPGRRWHGGGLPARRDRSQDWLPVARRARRAAAAAAASSATRRPLPVVAGAAADRDAARAGPGDSGDRSAARAGRRRRSAASCAATCAPHDEGDYDADLAHARARERTARRAAAGSRPNRDCAMWCRRSSSWSGVRNRSRLAARRVPGPAAVARLPRDDLPGALQRRDRRPEQAAHQEAAHRTAAAQATPPAARAQPRFVAPALLIDQRPAAVDEREPRR